MIGHDAQAQCNSCCAVHRCRIPPCWSPEKIRWSICAQRLLSLTSVAEIGTDLAWKYVRDLTAPCRVRHIVYSCVPRPDAKTARLRGAVEAAGGLWREVLALSEADLAQLVRADKVDILVDLTGHTANNRLGTFAMRPAPIQVLIPLSIL